MPEGSTINALLPGYPIAPRLTCVLVSFMSFFLPHSGFSVKRSMRTLLEDPVGIEPTSYGLQPYTSPLGQGSK